MDVDILKFVREKIYDFFSVLYMFVIISRLING